MKILKWLDDHFEESLLVLLLVLIACVELLQVIVRKTPFLNALTWPEEFCRFCWIWSVFLTLPYTIRKGSMLRVSVLADLLPQRARKVVGILTDLIVAGVMAFLFRHAVGVVSGIRLSAETSPAMAWPMWIVYSVMLAGFFLGAVRSLQMAVIHLRRFGEKEPTAREQTLALAAAEAEAGRLSGAGPGGLAADRGEG